MARPFATLGVVLLLGTLSRAARAESPWDTAPSVLTPSLRLSSTLHATELPGSLELCHPAGKTCTPTGTSVKLHGGTAVTTGFGMGIDMIALGPFRLGLSFEFGWGKGPELRFSPTQALSGSWGHVDAGPALGLKLRHGPLRAFGEIVPGLMTMEASVSGRAANGLALSAINDTFMVAARAGVGIALRSWFTAGIYAGGAVGSFDDVTGGIRLDFHEPRKLPDTP